MTLWQPLFYTKEDKLSDTTDKGTRPIVSLSSYIDLCQ